MREKITVTLVLLFLLGNVLSGQDHKELFGKRKEVYFTFKVNSRQEANQISPMISIDNFRNDTVWAYANMGQFLKFSRLGYDITLLSPPGDAPGVVMKNEVTFPDVTWNFYPTYSAYEGYMNSFQSTYPAICKVETIGTLASGRKLLAVKISDNVATDESEPEFFYTSSIHGDETTGYVLMLHLIEYLLSNYGTDPEATSLVNNMEIFINPLANPNGTYAGGDNTVTGATRGNANGIDLNRNYPDPRTGDHPDGNSWQEETVAFMNYASTHHFVASANFHGGAEVVNYPWDTWNSSSRVTADDNWWQYVSHEYADTAQYHASLLGNTTYLTSVSSDGVTNGGDWYIVTGGRQDYMNYWHHCREVTIEISNTKLLAAGQLLNHWEYNQRSFILFIKQAGYGIHGVITDEITGLPVAAKVFISGHDVDNSEVYSTANPGDYHRLLKAGTYTLTVSAPNYITKTISNVVVTDKNTVTLNIQLTPSTAPIVTTLPATTVTGTTAVLNGTVNPNGYSTTYYFEWGTTTSYGNSSTVTSAGAGTSAVSVNASISGLTAGVVYHFRLVATNSGGTSNGSDLTFTTSCGIISSFPWNEGFENAGAIPACWTQELVGTSTLYWTFITGNGGSYPSTAHGGTYNALLKDNSSSETKTKLVSPPINLSSVSSPVLKFWHYMAVWSGDQDQLIVYYKTSSGGTWTSLATYTTSVSSWTERTISLPNASSDYYIAFEGNAKYGYGVCVDDVSITGTSSPTLSVSPSDRPVTAAAGSTTFSVTSNSSWTASSNPSWCTVTSSGTGNGTITANYTQNTTSSQRVANITVTVSGLSPVVVTVTQAAPTLSVSPSDRPVTAAAGSTTFSVTSNSSWTASSNQTWCTVTSSGAGDGTITANYTANTVVTSRVANITVTVSGLTPVVVTVTQEGITPTLSVTPSNQNVASSAGNTSFSVISNTAWSASCDQTWCSVTLSGNGNGSIIASYSANLAYVERIAIITVNVSGLAPVTVTVTQEAAPAPEFNYIIANDIQTSDRRLEFDLYLLDTQPSVPFELSIIQAGILVDHGILNGGTITASIVSGTSELVDSQKPTSITYTDGTPFGCIKIAGRIAPGCGAGTIIGTESLGTRICRVRITNSVAFASSSQANLAFNFTITPYPTKVFQYTGTPCTSVELTCNPTNCFSQATNPVLNGPPYLTVTPNNRSVDSPAGSTTFSISANAAFTVTSSQSWCTVSPTSGFGNKTITANYSENTSPTPRVANLTITVSGVTPVVVTVTQAGLTTKTLNMTLFLEGLYSGTNTMNPAMNASGYQWGSTIADVLTLELHEGANYSNIVQTTPNVSLLTNGTATVTVPSSYNGSYYLTITHRNHILTTTASPVSFSSTTINYSFDNPGAAFGGNVTLMAGGNYAFYAGDVTHDRIIDGSDLSAIGNQNDLFATGYLPEDVNGDGLIDGTDMNITGNNNDLFVGSMTP